MIKCAKNTIETVWWEIDESLFFSPCRNPKQELLQTEPLDAPCADTWAHPAPPRAAAHRHTTLTPFPRRMCLQAGGKLPCTAKTCLASESKMQARTKQKHTLAHAPGTSKPPLLAPAQHEAPENAITSHAPAGCASTVTKSPLYL